VAIEGRSRARGENLKKKLTGEEAEFGGAKKHHLSYNFVSGEAGQESALPG